MISSDFVKNLWNKWRFNVSLMLFVTVDTPDPYLILRIKMAPEGRRRTKTKDNEVNPVWNEEYTFFLDGAVDNKLRMFTNPRQIVSIICSPLDVKNCRLFCLHRVFSLKGWGEWYLRRLHCKCDGKPVFYLYVYLQFTKSGGKEGKNSVVSQNRSCLCSLYWSMNDIL